MADTAYISKSDYLYHIRTERLNQILEEADEDEDLILDSAEADALAMIRKHLDKQYNMDLEFSKTGTDRHKVILRWAKLLTIAYIYERIPDEMVPDRVKDNHEMVMKMLRDVEKGDADVPGLTVNQVADGTSGGTKPYTRLRWGSQRRRSNDGGSPRYLDR